MATHSSTLAWQIPWTEEPGRLQSIGSLWVGHDWAFSLSLFTFIHWRRKWQPTPVFLPGESQGWGSLVGCRLWGHTRVGHDWSDLAAAAAVHFSLLIPKLLMFTLVISCLTTSNLLWFMDLPFQVPMQYCSLQHRTLLLSPVTSTTVCCFCSGSIPSFFLELFLYWSPVAYWAPNDPGSSSYSVLSFCLFILFMGFSWQEYWSGLPFPSPVDHILSDLFTMTHLSWVAPHGPA